jgi:hypothetical protein
MMRHRTGFRRQIRPHTRRMRIKRQAFELNVNQIEYFAHIWITWAVMKPQCTYIVLLSLFTVQSIVYRSSGNA